MRRSSCAGSSRGYTVGSVVSRRLEPSARPRPRNVFVVGLDEDVAQLIDRARSVLDGVDGPVDAIVGYGDFPVSTLVALKQGIPGTRNPSRRQAESLLSG
ncbi:hypothetical protein [Streptomyces sp. MBT53]|uniref:hypothetical protein n=1 Tax=Streptomyces sp. MBT53 TaxID=1488384 RepID=UPI0019116043|nr:hypothetical protein [Streptomyces sp. MBT53]MBK6014045.1 hypothetical protein [Streptomyces sp. MBT53]